MSSIHDKVSEHVQNHMKPLIRVGSEDGEESPKHKDQLLVVVMADGIHSLHYACNNGIPVKERLQVLYAAERMLTTYLWDNYKVAAPLGRFTSLVLGMMLGSAGVLALLWFRGVITL